MDITSGIAQASMELASSRVALGAQVAVMKSAMEMQQETMAVLLKSMGVGQNMNIKA